MGDPIVAISFKDLEPDEEVREEASRRLSALADEFPEPSHIEVAFEPDGEGFSAHAHVTGGGIDVATSSHAPELPLAADRLFDRLAKQLRRAHDKRLFARRRVAMTRNPKRKPRP